MNPIRKRATIAILGVVLVTSHGCWSSQDSLPLRPGEDAGLGDTDTQSGPAAPPCGLAEILDIHAVDEVAWVVGFGPRALVLEQGEIRDISTPTSFTSVWALSQWEAFAAGGDSIYHFENDEWTLSHTDASTVFFDLWGTNHDSVWAVGTKNSGNGDTEPVIWRYHDGLWTDEGPLPGTGLETIWGSSENNIYAAGENNTSLRFAGGTWSQHPVFPDPNVCIGAVTGTDGDDVWLLGSGVPIMHFDGDHWQPVTVGNSPSFGLDEITGSAASPGVVFALGKSSQAPPVDNQAAHLWKVGLSTEQTNSFSTTPVDMEPNAVSAVSSEKALVGGKAHGQAVLLEWKKEKWRVICR